MKVFLTLGKSDIFRGDKIFFWRLKPYQKKKRRNPKFFRNLSALFQSVRHEVYVTRVCTSAHESMTTFVTRWVASVSRDPVPNWVTKITHSYLLTVRIQWRTKRLQSSSVSKKTTVSSFFSFVNINFVSRLFRYFHSCVLLLLTNVSGLVGMSYRNAVIDTVKVYRLFTYMVFILPYTFTSFHWRLTPWSLNRSFEFIMKEKEQRLLVSDFCVLKESLLLLFCLSEIILYLTSLMYPLLGLCRCRCITCVKYRVTLKFPVI